MCDSQSIEEFVEQQLADGEYDSREELIKEALRQMQEREAELDRLADHMREAAEEIKRGDPGVTLDAETVIQRSLERESTSRNGA